MAGGVARRLHVTLVTAVFPPEAVVSSQTSAAIAVELRRRGHRVTVIAPFPSKAGRQEGVARRRFGFASTVSPVWGRVIRCPTWFSRGAGLITRLVEYLTFGMTSTLAFFSTERPDVLYVNSWPLFGAGPIVAAARARRVPVVLSIQDVYPESLVAQGRFQEGSFAVRLMQATDGAIARHVFRAVVLDKDFRSTYARTRSLPEDRVEVIANFIAPEVIVPDCVDGVLIRKKHGIPAESLLAVYAGNVGPASGAEDLVRAFAYMPPQSALHLLVAGQGSNLEGCRRLSRELRCKQVAFESPWRVEDTSAVLAAADVLVLPTRGGQAVASMPSKIISYMLAARPMVVQATPGSPLATTVSAAECGVVVPPEDPRAMAMALMSFATLPPEVRRERGKAGRSYALAHFTPAVCLPVLVGLLELAATASARQWHRLVSGKSARRKTEE